MSYVIRDGKLETAKPIKSLTEEQKKILRLSTPRQQTRVSVLKAKLAQ